MGNALDIVIVGTGPVGTWLGSELLDQGRGVGFIDRDSTPRTREWIMESRGIVRNLKAKVDPSCLRAAKTIIVTTRAHHLESVWNELLIGLPEAKGHAVIVCSNGLIEGILGHWRAKRPDISFYLGIVTAGVTEKEPGYFVRSDQSGRCFFGPVGDIRERPDIIATRDHVSSGGLSGIFEWDPRIQERARRKWLFNTAANTLAGAMRLPRNDLMITNHRNFLRTLFDEAYDLACEMWTDWRENDRKSPASRETLWLELCQLIADTGGNENSMSRAARLGKGTGEARFLGGVAFGHTGYPELKRMTRILTG